MRIAEFWVVTKPGPKSSLEDICFKTDDKGLGRQVLGGLRVDEIHGMYTDEAEAKREAERLLDDAPVDYRWLADRAHAIRNAGWTRKEQDQSWRAWEEEYARVTTEAQGRAVRP